MIDVILSDAEMRGAVDGFTLAKWINENRPGIKDNGGTPGDLWANHTIYVGPSSHWPGPVLTLYLRKGAVRMDLKWFLVRRIVLVALRLRHRPSGSSETFAGPPASSIRPRRKSALSSTVCTAKSRSPNSAAATASPRACITAGQKSSSKPGHGNFTYSSSTFSAPSILTGGITATDTASLTTISTSVISATYIQIRAPPTFLSCGSNLADTMRYTSGTMQVCNGSG